MSSFQQRIVRIDHIFLTDIKTWVSYFIQPLKANPLVLLGFNNNREKWYTFSVQNDAISILTLILLILSILLSIMEL